MTSAETPSCAEMSFISNVLDRCSDKRGDETWVKSRLETADASVVLSNDNRLILRTSPAPTMHHRLDEALSLGALREEMIFLGQQEDGSAPVFATAVAMSDEDIDAADGITGIDLRTLALQNLLPDEDISALSQARAMIHWHRTHKFCSRCGEPSQLAEAGYRRDCPSCGGLHFPRTDPVVIMLITDGERALLGRPPRLAQGIFTTLAGFMEPGETIEQAVRRETMEEAGISVGDVRLVCNQPWPFPSNLMLGCIGNATSSEIHMDENELEACRWCDRAEVRQMIDGTHPDGDMIPPSISIAHQLIVGWIEGRIS